MKEANMLCSKNIRPNHNHRLGDVYGANGGGDDGRWTTLNNKVAEKWPLLIDNL